MPDIARLTCPAEDASSTIALNSMTPADLLRWVVSKSGGRLGWNEKGDKGFLKFLTAPPQKVAVATTKPKAPPYYTQRDSQVWRNGENQAGRMCFSTSCAMLLKDLKPGALSDSPNADDDYLRRVFEYGDTTIAENQLRALSHFGLEARFTTSMTVAQLDALLAKGKRVVCGLLHHGPVTAPSGGGHYMLVYGKESTGYRLHDPYGEMDLVNGGYVGTNGKAQLYSHARFTARWCVENDHCGYALWVA